MQFGIFNALDMFLLIILFIGLLVGFIRGAWPQLISLGSIWLGLLGAHWLYKLLSINIVRSFFDKNLSDAISFSVLLIVMFVVIRLIIKALTTAPEVAGKKKKKKNPADPLDEARPSFRERFVIGPLSAGGGMVMGLILTSIWTAIILGVLQFWSNIEASDVPGVDVSGLGIVGQLQGSYLIFYFNRVLWLIVQSIVLFVEPVDPSADILQRVVSTITLGGG
jgi:hypothetical protein